MVHTDSLEECKQRSFKVNLNKITSDSDNYHRVLDQMCSISIKDPHTLIGFVDQIFNKAVNGSDGCEACAQLCQDLHQRMPGCVPALLALLTRPEPPPHAVGHSPAPLS